MKASDLKAWLDTVHFDATIEVERYGWDALEPLKIRAVYQSMPPIPKKTMEDVCNLEDVKS